jgi:pentatricopeptide repeat protein
MTIASMKHLRSIGLPFKNSVLRRFLKLGSFRQGNERFEQMIAAGCRLEETLRRRGECRGICFSDKAEAGREACEKCTTAVDEAERRYQQAMKELRDSF